VPQRACPAREDVSASAHLSMRAGIGDIARKRGSDPNIQGKKGL
jgi:hypothetical protein